VQKVVVYGAGGQGRVVIDILEKEQLYEIAGLVDDDQKLWGTSVYGYKVLGGADRLSDLLAAGVWGAIVTIGDNKVRALLMRRVSEAGFELVSTVHPSAVVARGAKLGPGCVVMANTTLSPGVELGEGVMVGTASNIAHDNIIGNYVYISAGVHFAGTVQVGDFGLIGVGAAIAPNVRIGRDVVIGAGASVISDIPDNATAVGVPARVIRR